jgi:hypothetical protein
MSGEIVYEVPPGSKGLQLDYRPFLRGDTRTWYIGDADALPQDALPQAEAPQTETPETRSASASPVSDQVPTGSETEVVEAAEDYYQAVDQENWAYTYDNLDSQTKALFTEEEWYLKNQWFADNEGLELATINVMVNGTPSDPEVSVTVYRTFKDGTSITHNTYFVSEDGEWKHRRLRRHGLRLQGRVVAPAPPRCIACRRRRSPAVARKRGVAAASNSVVPRR